MDAIEMHYQFEVCLRPINTSHVSTILHASSHVSMPGGISHRKQENYIQRCVHSEIK